MAFEFAYIELDEGTAKKAGAPKAKPQVEIEAVKGAVEPGRSEAEPSLLGLPHAKPEPKPRGRKKPSK